MRVRPEPREYACRVRYEAGRDRQLWLAGYPEEVPKWSCEEDDAIWVTEEVATALKARFGLAVAGGKLRLLDRSPTGETERLKQLLGRDYWEQVASE